MKKKIHTLMSLTLLLACCLVFTAQAQVLANADVAGTEERENPQQITLDEVITVLSSTSNVSDSWIKNTDRQFATSLKSRDEAVLEQALQNVIHIATFQGEKFTFKKAVSPLLNVYIFDKEEDHRLMALSALHAIGDTYGMQRLRELVNDDSSERIRRLTRRALADYYGPK